MTTSISAANAPSRKVSFFGALFFFSLSAFTVIIGKLSLSESHENYKSWLTENASVIISDTGSTIFYGTPLFIASIFLYGCYGLYMGLKGQRSLWFDKYCTKPLGIMAVAGLALIFVGKHAGTTYWEHQFKEHGYVRCNGSFILTSKWSIDVWALNPSICMDPNLKDALRHSGGSVYEINSYYTPPEAEPVSQ